MDNSWPREVITHTTVITANYTIEPHRSKKWIQSLEHQLSWEMSSGMIDVRVVLLVRRSSGPPVAPPLYPVVLYLQMVVFVKVSPKFSGIIQTVLYCDFFYYYAMSKWYGNRLVLPGNSA